MEGTGLGSSSSIGKDGGAESATALLAERSGDLWVLASIPASLAHPGPEELPIRRGQQEEVGLPRV